MDEVSRAANDPIDYIGLGPVFSTSVKPGRPPIGPELIGEAMASTRLPLFAIGGINGSNLAQLSSAGCRRIAVIGAIMAASDPAAASLTLLETLSKL